MLLRESDGPELLRNPHHDAPPSPGHEERLLTSNVCCNDGVATAASRSLTRWRKGSGSPLP